MEIISGARMTGKTTELIRKSAESGSYMVVATMYEAARAMGAAAALGLQIPTPITYSEFERREYAGNNIRGFLIDNADRLLQQMTHVPIESITIGAVRKPEIT